MRDHTYILRFLLDGSANARNIKIWAVAIITKWEIKSKQCSQNVHWFATILGIFFSTYFILINAIAKIIADIPYKNTQLF